MVGVWPWSALPAAAWGVEGIAVRGGGGRGGLEACGGGAEGAADTSSISTSSELRGTTDTAILAAMA